MRLLTILAFIILAGCGLDPDDYAPQQADGCPSTGCPESEPEPAKEATPAPEAETAEETPPATGCSEGKICPGMSKAEVLTVLPAPDKVTDYGDGFVTWTYKEDKGKSRYCYERYSYSWNNCKVYFEFGLMESQDSVNPEWLEL